MIRSAPICFAERTPNRPTAPSPTTTAVAPGLTFAAAAANQPVPNTSDVASRLGIRSSDGTSGVATNVPSASGARRIGACAVLTNSRRWQDVWYPAWQWGQMLSEARTSQLRTALALLSSPHYRPLRQFRSIRVPWAWALRCSEYRDRATGRNHTRMLPICE